MSLPLPAVSIIVKSWDNGRTMSTKAILSTPHGVSELLKIGDHRVAEESCKIMIGSPNLSYFPLINSAARHLDFCHRTLAQCCMKTLSRDHASMEGREPSACHQPISARIPPSATAMPWYTVLHWSYSRRLSDQPMTYSVSGSSGSMTLYEVVKSYRDQDRLEWLDVMAFNRNACGFGCSLAL